jgi:MFS family permease
LLALLALPHAPTVTLLYVMVVSQGMLGYGLTSVIGAIPAEIFEGRHYGSVFGTLMLTAIGGGAAGPWVAGALYDLTGSYTPAFWIAIAGCVLSALASGLAERPARCARGRRRLLRKSARLAVRALVSCCHHASPRPHSRLRMIRPPQRSDPRRTDPATVGSVSATPASSRSEPRNEAASKAGDSNSGNHLRHGRVLGGKASLRCARIHAADEPGGRIVS